jgi:hypothetical protein
MSPVKSPVSSLPPLNGSLNVAKRRKVDGLSPSDHRRVYSAASPKGGGDETGSREAAVSAGSMVSLVTPSKRSVSTPARLGTPRGGQRTPSLADRPIPVLMPREEEDDVSRSRRSSYANLYVMEETTADIDDKGDASAITATTSTATTASNDKSISPTSSEADTVSANKGKEVEKATPENTSASAIDTSQSSDKSFSESAPIESVESAKLKATLLPPPEVSERLEPPASPKKEVTKLK